MVEQEDIKVLRGVDKIKFKEEWDSVVKCLKESGADLSKIFIAPKYVEYSDRFKNKEKL